MAEKVKRDLSGMYFRWQNPETGKWENWCFEDLPEDEQDKILETKDLEFIKGMVKILANCMEEYAEQFKERNGEAIIWLDSISALFPESEYTLDVSNRFDKIRELLKQEEL